MRGPNGEVRKGSTVQGAVQSMRIATGQEQETYAKPKRQPQKPAQQKRTRAA